MAKTKKQVKKEKGEGSFRKRSNGTFEYRIVYTDEYNEIKRKSFYGQSDIICMKKAEKFLCDLEKKKSGIDIDATIPDIVKEKYQSDLEKNFVHEQGYSRNMANLRIIEKSFIGDVPICELTEFQVDMFLRSITHYSNSTIGKVFLQLKMAFREACNRDIIQKNIMLSNNLRCPKSNKPDKKVKALTRCEQAKFAAFLQNYKGQKNRNDYSRQLLIELFTGMRMGEINALTPECIDFEKDVIHIRSTVARGENYRDFIKNGTKTDAGVRDIPIMNMLKPILKDAIDNKSENPFNLIFYDEQKNGIISTSQVNCFFKRVCEKCGIEKRGQHSLRHTFATRCIEANVPAIVLKKWLGHTDIHITLDTYADVFDSMNNDSITKLDSYIVNLAG
ncbi:MAG: site-specific integrase [Acetobacter sp.]|nr:site-specific integrase [Bacteroides sp.]MCM1341792.1 site-specific integrase [Acetobacter sp.]MCM1433134.1 site-specific integrase [Clostridiales bacterium]